jgi:hypothetical protein
VDFFSVGFFSVGFLSVEGFEDVLGVDFFSPSDFGLEDDFFSPVDEGFFSPVDEGFFSPVEEGFFSFDLGVFLVPSEGFFSPDEDGFFSLGVGDFFSPEVFDRGDFLVPLLPELFFSGFFSLIVTASFFGASSELDEDDSTFF